jgi:hypothetical protein
MVLAELEGHLSKSPNNIIGVPETRRALNGGCDPHVLSSQRSSASFYRRETLIDNLPFISEPLTQEVDQGRGAIQDDLEWQEEGSSEYEEAGDNPLCEDKEFVHYFKGENLNNNPLSSWKHNTISEDRTSESGWKEKRLAGVLRQVSRDSPRQQKEPVENVDTSLLLKPDDETDEFVTRRRSGAVFTLGGSSPDSTFYSTSEPKQEINQDSHLNTVLSAAMAPYTSEYENDTRSNDRPEIENGKLLRASTNNKECEHSEQYRLLMARIEALEQENNLLKSWIDPDWNHQGRPFFQIVHRFEGDDKIFFKPPSWTRESYPDGNRYTLKGSSLSMKRKEYLQRSENLAFSVFKSYTPDTVDTAKGQGIEPPNPESETVLFVSNEMKRAIQNYLDKQPDFKQLFPFFDVSSEIPSPYLFWYCTRSSYESVLEELPSHQRALVRLFGQWVDANYEAEYARVNDQIKRGVISCQSIKYLIRPGDPLVFQEMGLLRAYQATSWANNRATHRGRKKGDVGASDKVWEVSVWSYEFDGVFYQKPAHLEIELDVTDPHEEVALSSLKVTPLECASPEVREKLENRGKTYWACRKKRFISYSGGDKLDSLNNVSITSSLVRFL